MKANITGKCFIKKEEEINEKENRNAALRGDGRIVIYRMQFRRERGGAQGRCC